MPNEACTCSNHAADLVDRAPLYQAKFHGEELVKSASVTRIGIEDSIALLEEKVEAGCFALSDTSRCLLCGEVIRNWMD